MSKSSPKRNLMYFTSNIKAQVRVEETKVKSCRTNKKVVKQYNKYVCFTFHKRLLLSIDYGFVYALVAPIPSSQIECECLLLPKKERERESNQ